MAEFNTQTRNAVIKIEEHLRVIRSILEDPTALQAALVEVLRTPLNHYGEGIGECIQGQLERGRRQS